MKRYQRQTLKEILALWEHGLITLPIAIRRIGQVFVTTEDDFTSEERRIGQAQRDAGITAIPISRPHLFGRRLGGCMRPLVAA